MAAFPQFIDSLPDFIIAMAVSIFCGFIIGIERESRGKAAGARTLVLISLGSSLFVEISIILSGDYGDPARVAAQIVSGIGFLGAGAILQQSEKGYIQGLTTAASIWVTAAIGMIVGSGKYGTAIVAALVTVVALRVLRWIEKYFFYIRKVEDRFVVFEKKGGKTEWLLLGILEDHMLGPEDYSFEKFGKKKAVLKMKYVPTSRNHRSFLTDISDFDEIVEIRSTKPQEDEVAS